MNRKMYWGIAALIIILIAAGGFMYWQWSQVAQFKEQLAQDEKMLEENDKVQHAAVTTDEKPPDERGYKWVRHNDHFHEVPIDAPDEWNDTPITQPALVPQTYTGPLTYHKELLEKHPVEALRLQAKERGHWSAKWIPPFPPDDTEAAAIARFTYLITYYDSIDDTTNPICQKALRNLEAWIKADRERRKELSKQLKVILSAGLDFIDMEAYKRNEWESARQNDLGKLTWSRVTEGLIIFPERESSTFTK